MSNNVGSSSASAALDGSDDPWTLAKARFLADLDPSERDIFNNATLENLFYATNNANRDDAEKSRVRALATKLGPLVSAIESYGKALDTFAQIAPLYLSPIWGSIRVLLVLARSYGKFFERFVDTLGRIGDVLPRFRDYERIYSREKHQRLTGALSNAYLEIIVLCTQFRKTIREQKISSFRRLIKPLSLDRQFDEAVERFRQHKKNVDEEARVCHMIEAAEKRDAELILFAAERKRRLLARLSTVGFEYKHQKLKSLRYKGTGTWLLEDKEYVKWANSAQSAVLCCHGIPGCGKSVLASSIVDTLVVSSTIIYYYCDYSDKRTLDPANLFGTLARQVLVKMEGIPEDLAIAIENAAQDENRLTDTSCALGLLRRSIEQCEDPINIAIDGIDEMTEQSQKTICSGLKELMNGDLSPIRLFLTGRENLSRSLDIPSTLPFTSISISSSMITSDIRKFVEASTRRKIVEGTLVLQDPGLEELIVSELVSGAKGMFLWVQFQLCDLCEAESDYGIRLVLENLPKSLSETYDRLLGKIEGPERRNMILRMFKWIVCARQPLHVDELREGIAFTLEDEDWRKEKIPTNLNRLIRACGNLVIVDAATNIVRLAHYTVQQYLLKGEGGFFQFGIKDADRMAGEFCLAYLTFSCFETQVTRYGRNSNTDIIALQKMASSAAFIAPDHPARKVIQAWNIIRSPRAAPSNINMVNVTPRSKLKAELISAFRFLEYVMTHWLWHTVDFEPASYTGRRDKMFTDLVCWKDLLFDFRPWASFNQLTEISSSVALLGWALMADQTYLLRMTALERDQFKPTELISDAWRDFVDGGWACLIDDSQVASLQTLQKEPYHLNPAMRKAELQLQNSKWLLSQLLFACQNGHLRTLQAVDWNHLPGMARDAHLISFLILLTAGSGQLSVIEFLNSFKPVRELKLRLVWVNNQTWRSSLQCAFDSRHFDIVLYLVCSGYSTVDELCLGKERYLSLLGNTIATGDSEASSCLLNPELTAPFQVTPQDLSDLFILSVQQGLLIVVALMLQIGVHPDKPDRGCQVPIIEAIRTRNQEMVSLLLDHRCKLEATQHGLPLTVAASMGCVEICKLLITAGAEVFSGSYKDSRAAAMLSLQTLDTKSRHRRRVTFPETNLDTPRIAQQQSSSISLPEDPQTIPQNGKQLFEICLSPTPLYMACCSGHKYLVEVLLEHGAAIDFPSPTHVFHAVSTGAPFCHELTSRACIMRPDGRLCEDKTLLPSQIRLVPEWKYPVAVSIEQGYRNIFPLRYAVPYGTLYDLGDISIDNLCIDFIHQCTIYHTILKNWASKIPETDPRYKQAIFCGLQFAAHVFPEKRILIA